MPFLLSVDESKLGQVAKDGAGVAMELMRGLSTHIIKELLFNRAPCNCGKGGRVGENDKESQEGAAVPMES